MLLGCRDDKPGSKYDDAYTGFMHIYLYLYLATTTHIEPFRDKITIYKLEIYKWNLHIGYEMYLFINKPMEAFIHGTFSLRSIQTLSQLLQPFITHPKH